jgi:hypothetical protein
MNGRDLLVMMKTRSVTMDRHSLILFVSRSIGSSRAILKPFRAYCNTTKCASRVICTICSSNIGLQSRKTLDEKGHGEPRAGKQSK